MKNNFMKTFAILIFTLGQLQPIFAQEAVAKLPLVSQQITQNAGPKYLLLAGEGENKSLILIQIEKKFIFSFKYCAIKPAQSDQLLQEVRKNYFSQSDDDSQSTIEANTALAAKLFASPICETMTKNQFYAIHLFADDPVASPLRDQAEHPDGAKIEIASGIFLGSAAFFALVRTYVQFARAHKNYSTLSIPKLLMSQGAGKVEFFVTLIAGLATAGTLYERGQKLDENRTLYALSNLIDRQGTLLLVDGDIQSARDVLSAGITRAVRAGHFSAL